MRKKHINDFESIATRLGDQIACELAAAKTAKCIETTENELTKRREEKTGPNDDRQYNEMNCKLETQSLHLRLKMIHISQSEWTTVRHKATTKENEKSINRQTNKNNKTKETKNIKLRHEQTV